MQYPFRYITSPHTIFVTPCGSNVMAVHCSFCVSAHTLLIMDFKVKCVNARCGFFTRVLTQDNQLQENGIECWNYVVEHKIITCKCHLHMMNYCIGSVQQVP